MGLYLPKSTKKIVDTFLSTDGTFVHSGNSNSNMLTTLKTNPSLYLSRIIAGNLMLAAESNTKKSGKCKGILKINLPANAAELDWDYAHLNLIPCVEDNVAPYGTGKAYLVGDYNLTIITWNNFPVKVAGTPEIPFESKEGTCNFDITPLIKFAIKKGITSLNIALEYVANDLLRFYSERGGIEDCTPTLQLLRREYVEKVKLYMTGENLSFEKVKKVYLNNEVVYSAGSTVTYVVDTDVTYTEEVDCDDSCLTPTTFTPMKSGWTFVGWREDTTASGSVLSDKMMGDDPITLYAVFKQDITLTYDGNSADSGSITAQTGIRYYNNGSVNNPTFVLAENEFDRTNSTFIDWAQDSVDGTRCSVGDTVTLSEDTTFYAKWSVSVDISVSATDVELHVAPNTETGTLVAITLSPTHGGVISGVVTYIATDGVWTGSGHPASATMYITSNPEGINTSIYGSWNGVEEDISASAQITNAPNVSIIWTLSSGEENRHGFKFGNQTLSGTEVYEV